MLRFSFRTFIFLFIAFSSTLFGQRTQIDSLLFELKKAPNDSIKVTILGKLGELCEFDDILKYTQPLIQLVKKKHSVNATAKRGFYAKQLADAYNNSAVFYDNTGQLDSAEHFYKLALNTHELNDDKIGKATALNNLGHMYETKGENALALKYHSASLQLWHELNDSEHEAVSLNNIGLIYSKQGQTTRALDFYLKSHKIAEQYKFKRLLSVVLSNIAGVYSDSKEYKMALKYQLKSLKINEELADKFLLGQSFYNVGVVHLDLKNFDKALEYLKSSYKLQREINDKKWASISLIEIANVYFKTERKDSALVYLNEGLRMALEADNLRNECDARRMLGEIYFEKKNYAKALEFGEKSLEISKKLGYPLNISKAARLLSNAYSATGNYEKALSMANLFSQMQDSLYNQNARNSAIRSQLQLEFSEKEMELRNQQQLRLEKIKSENELLRNRNQRNLAWVILIAAVTILVLASYIILQKSKRKRIELLNERNRMIYKLQAINAQMNPHFIFNAINSIQHYILSNESQFAYDYLARFGQLIRLVLIHSEANFISLKDEINLLGIYFDLEQRRFKNRFTYKINCPDEIDDVKIPTMLLQPLVENAIWHGIMNLDESVKGEVILSFHLKNNTLEITIEDNGVGLKESARRRNSPYESVGINFINKRVEILKAINMQEAKITIVDLADTSVGKSGTKVIIELPLKVSYEN